MISNETDKIIEELFKSFLQKHQEGLEQSMKGSEFIFDSADLLYYKFHRISLNRGRSYTDSPKWLKNKKATINPKNNDDRCFQYAITVALHHQSIESDPQKISKTRLFIDQYDWKKIYFPSNNKSIALNILYVPYNTKGIRHAYKSEHNLKSKIILL